MMIKKWFGALVLALLLVASAAMAEDVKVTFATKSGQVNGGMAYDIQLKLSRAASQDMTLCVACQDLGETYQVSIPAGESTATLTITPGAVNKKTTAVFTVQEGEGYTASGQHTLTLRPLPEVHFYLAVNFGTVGRKTSVRVMTNKSSSVVKGSVFQLRNEEGAVLAERVWSNPNADMFFTFTPTAEQEGYHRMSVWLGEHKVADAGYLTVMDGNRKIIRQADTQQMLVGIGIDCGSGGKNMDKVLEVLDKHNTNVTFFMTGFFVRTYTEEARRALAAGNEIGDHSNTHPPLTKERPYDMLRQLVYPAECMAELLGVSPRLMRPPYGDTNSKLLSISRSEGMEGIMWSMDTKDSVGKYTTEESIKWGTTKAKLAPGKILLTHLDSNRSWEIIDACLTYYEEQGYTVVPISALLYASGASLPEMPSTRETLLYTDEYWLNWLAEHNIPVDTKE